MKRIRDRGGFVFILSIAAFAALTLVPSGCDSNVVSPTGAESWSLRAAPGVESTLQVYGLGATSRSLGTLSPDGGGGASTASGFECSVGPAGVTTNSQAVLYPTGGQTLFCRGRTSSPPGRTEVISGEPCTLFFGGVTTISQLTLSKSGTVTLYCRSM